MKINVSELEIPKATASAAEALNIVTGDNPDTRLLEKAIMHDPVLASTLLRYANSPLMRRASEIESVPAALRLLGLNSVRSAVVTATIRSLLPQESVAGQAILNHMIAVSTYCRLLALRLCPPRCDELEFLGLVHDVGVLTLLSNYFDEYSGVLQQSILQGNNLDDLELAEFGISHNVVSARTAHEFRLSSHLCGLLQEFHNPSVLRAIESEDDMALAILTLAHEIYTQVTEECVIRETVTPSEQILPLLGLSRNDWQSILEEAASLTM